MRSSIWHPTDELPCLDRFSTHFIQIVIADDEFLVSALFSPKSRKLAPFDWNSEYGYRRWFEWTMCSFTRWAYFSDFLNIE